MNTSEGNKNQPDIVFKEKLVDAMPVSFFIDVISILLAIHWHQIHSFCALSHQDKGAHVITYDTAQLIAYSGF